MSEWIICIHLDGGHLLQQPQTQQLYYIQQEGEGYLFSVEAFVGAQVSVYKHEGGGSKGGCFCICMSAFLFKPGEGFVISLNHTQRRYCHFHGSGILASLTWPSSCQQHTFTQILPPPYIKYSRKILGKHTVHWNPSIIRQTQKSQGTGSYP